MLLGLMKALSSMPVQKWMNYAECFWRAVKNKIELKIQRRKEEIKSLKERITLRERTLETRKKKDRQKKKQLDEMLQQQRLAAAEMKSKSLGLVKDAEHAQDDFRNQKRTAEAVSTGTDLNINQRPSRADVEDNKFDVCQMDAHSSEHKKTIRPAQEESDIRVAVPKRQYSTSVHSYEAEKRNKIHKMSFWELHRLDNSHNRMKKIKKFFLTIFILGILAVIIMGEINLRKMNDMKQLTLAEQWAIIAEEYGKVRQKRNPLFGGILYH